MRSVDRPSGVRLRHADSYRIVEDAPERGPRRRGARAVASDAAEAAWELRPLLDALSEQRMDIVDTIPLEAVAPPPAPGAPRRRAAAAAESPEPLELTVPLAPGEQAVVLTERDGVYEWALPEAERPAPKAARRRAAGDPAAAPREAVFLIAVPPPAAPSPAGAPRRGVIADVVRGRVQAIVLRFVAKVVVGKAMTHLERDVATGLVVMDGTDPSAWRRVETLADIALPRDRPARILLAIHGTFSSTTGGFGGLCAHPWGRELLDAAGHVYDAVVGYDHRTLSVDPLENASDLLDRLRAGRALDGRPPRLDIIAHSRGGLVARSLTEHLLPGERDWPAEVPRMVFVACTNGGTSFAKADNWKAFIDLYTNLVMAASRLVDLVAPPLVGTVTRGAVSGVGAFVKYLVGALLDPAEVPGLAAMDPAGPFVETLNATQKGQPDPARGEMFVVSSNFEVGGVQDGPRELPPALLTRIGDAVVDQVFANAPNDLVVDVASMGAIDPKAGDFVDDRLAFDANGSVYHCNYFLREKVAQALIRWLDLEATVAGGGGDAAPPPPPPPGRVTRAPRVSARVSTDLKALPAHATVGAARRAISGRAPKFLVITQGAHAGPEYYAFPSGPELRRAVGRGPARRSLGAALELDAMRPSLTFDLAGVAAGDDVPAAGGDAGGTPPPARRGVVTAGDEIVGVLPAAGPVPETADELESGKVPGRAKRKAKARPRRPPTPAHVHAEMPPRVVVGTSATIAVEVSAEALRRARGPVSADAAIDPERLDPSRPLIVQVLARRNLEVVGEDRCEIALPVAGDPPAMLVFEVRGTSAGEGEVSVLARQDQISLAVLKLTPRVTAKAARRQGANLQAKARVLRHPALRRPRHGRRRRPARRQAAARRPDR